jgi:hypothetical protein
MLRSHGPRCRDLRDKGRAEESGHQLMAIEQQHIAEHWWITVQNINKFILVLE